MIPKCSSSLVHITCYWAQSCSALPEMSERYFLFSYVETNASGSSVVGYTRLAQRKGISWFVLASTLLLTWKLKAIRLWLTSVTLHRKGSSIWNITCPLQRSWLVGNTVPQQSRWKGDVNAYRNQPAGFQPALERMAGHRWVQRRGGWSRRPASSRACCGLVPFSPLSWKDLMSDG